MEVKELKTFSIDVEKGILLVNGKKIENVSAFSATFKDGEYGLAITRDDMYTSKVENSKIFLSVLSNEVFNKSVPSECKEP